MEQSLNKSDKTEVALSPEAVNLWIMLNDFFNSNGFYNSRTGKSMDIVNLTPHEVTFLDKHNNVIQTIPSSGKVARLSSNTITTDYINGIPVTETHFGEIENLPDPKPNTIYITSSLVAQNVMMRDDIYIPNESVRNEQGQIIGCRSLGII